ncbi:MAG: hypothetical protein H6R15_2655 [Proteobacteria bacterium]|nr:hypothetical protein [Pseudomonadota bacterium]
MSDKVAQDYIELFKNNKNYSGSPVGIVINYKIDANSLLVLRKGLASENSDVREKIVYLLKDLDDQTVQKPTSVLKTEQIIEILSVEGLSKYDAARNASINILINWCTQAMLEKYNKYYAKVLETAPGESLFLLIAKAKAIQAKNTVINLHKTERWKSDPYAEIAAAALGDTQIEDKYIAMAQKAADGDSLTDALSNLKSIGTRRSLQVVASFLRSPLVSGPLKISLRINALEALSYNFLNEPVLRTYNINSQDDYLAAERFCEETLGVRFEGPLPPFYVDTPLPTPLR